MIKHEKKNKGFTLMEMLIVVAIIAVLVAIAIPVLNNKLEKARQAVDMANARSIQTVLATLINTGEVEFPKEALNKNDKAIGLWVLVVRDKNSYPQNYTANNFEGGTVTVFCGTDSGVLVNGTGTAQWWMSNEALRNALGSLSGINSKSKEWDWYVVQYDYDPKTQSVRDYIYSGNKNGPSQVTEATASQTKIAQAMSRNNN